MMDASEAIDTLTKAGKSNDVQVVLNAAETSSQEAYAAIRADEDISDKGKEQRIASIYLQQRAVVDQKLSDLAARVVRTDREDAERVFGVKGLSGDPASLAISRRDATDRVAHAETKTELVTLLRNATRSGDETLARAVAQRAVESGDLDLLNAFLEDRPHLNDAAQRLWDADVEASRTFSSTMMLGWQLAALLPREMSGLGKWKIEAIANGGV